MLKQFTFGNRTIGEGHPVFMVAEISCNHHQKYEEAEALVREAHKVGVDAVKFQTYTPDTITLNSDKEWFRIGHDADNPKTWKGMTLYKIYQQAYTPWEWQLKLKKLADELGLLFFSSPFDTTAVDFLETLDVPGYKIASYEATDFTILRRVAQTGKPVIMSVGYASADEIDFALKTLRENGAGDIAILHCITDYKSKADEQRANLSTIADIAKRWGVVSGFSDNSGGIDVPVMAAKAGAAIIEKHLILDRALGGFDVDFSINPREFKELVEAVHGKKQHAIDEVRYQAVLGQPFYGPRTELEKANINLRRSLFAAKDIKKGEPFTSENVRSVRPAHGLNTKYYDQVIGKVATQDIEFATPLKEEHVDGSFE